MDLKGRKKIKGWGGLINDLILMILFIMIESM